jgi:hypothetical protein
MSTISSLLAFDVSLSHARARKFQVMTDTVVQFTIALFTRGRELCFLASLRLHVLLNLVENSLCLRAYTSPFATANTIPPLSELLLSGILVLCSSRRRIYGVTTKPEAMSPTPQRRISVSSQDTRQHQLLQLDVGGESFLIPRQ